jgi:hypothetical protein
MQTVLAISVQTTFLQTSSAADVAQNGIIRGLVYASLILNLGATLFSVLGLIILSDFPNRARYLAAKETNSFPYRAQQKKLSQADLRILGEGNEDDLLREFGMPPAWSVAKPAAVVGFILGIVCTFIGIGVCVWRMEAHAVSLIATAALAAVGGFTIFAFFSLSCTK